MSVGQLLCNPLLVLTLLSAEVCTAQPIAGPGYAQRSIDGDNDVGAHFAVANTPNGATGLFYLADAGRL
jgi:hypothetical protein